MKAGRKIISLFLSLLLAVTLIASCAGDTGSGGKDSGEVSAPVSDTDAVTIDERQLIREEVPDYTYDGTEFRTLIRDNDSSIEDMFITEDSGDVVDAAVFKRNQAIQERFDIKFVHIPSSSGEYETDALTVVRSGLNAYELVLPHGRVGIFYAREHILIDWNELPYIELSKPWWSQKASEEFTINEQLYFTTGSLSYRSLAGCNAIYFNKDIFDLYNVEYPYSTVREGTWTFDKMAELAKQMTADINSDGMINYADDRLGYITFQWTGPVNVLFAQGGHIASKDSDGAVILDFFNEKNITIFQRFFELTDSDNGYIYVDTKPEGKDVISTFGDGRAAFLEHQVGNMETLRSYDTNFGIIPCPKYDEYQENYLSIFDAGNHVFCVPITAIDSSEFISIILEAWAAEAYRTTIPAYYDVALSTKFSRDEESADMLDLIMEGGMVDIIYYSNGISIFSNSGMSLIEGSHDFASYYNKNVRACEVALTKLMRDFE